MSRSVLKARYTLTAIPDSDLVEIGILRKDLLRLTTKMTLWSMLPSALIIVGLIVISEYPKTPKPIVDINDITPPETD